MKKIFLIIAILTMPFAASAQGYKGFIDIFGGNQLGGGIDIPIPDHDNVTNIKNDLTFGLNVTGGYQITNFLFAGVGFGGYTTLMGATTHDYYTERERVFHSLYFPIFADVRWTLDINRKITPFVDMKIGYQFAFKLNSGGVTWYGSDEEDLYSAGTNGAYFMPSLGVRFGKTSGFNLGIAYNACIGTKYMQYREVGPDKFELHEVDKQKKGAFMITFGADF